MNATFSPIARPSRTSTSQFLVPISGNTVCQFKHAMMPERWQQPGTSTVLFLEHQIIRIRSLYDFRRLTQVTDFLRENKFLIPLLFEVYGKIGSYFSPSTRVVLEVVSDPEADDDVELFVLIQTYANPKEARACLDRLDEEWWLSVLHRAKCKMNIDLEYC